VREREKNQKAIAKALIKESCEAETIASASTEE
jgi:hypothetical protein